MNTDTGSSTAAPDPKRITEQLRREILELEVDTESLSSEDADDERWAYQHLVGLPISYNPAVTAATDGVIRSQPLSATGRAGALAVVKAQTTRHRSRNGLLPTLLRAVREERGIPLSALASQSGIDEEELRDLERGAKPVNRDQLPPETVAAWIRPLRPLRETVVIALRRSLDIAATDRPVLAAGAPEVPCRTDDDYINRVLAALDQPQEGNDQ